MNPFTHLRLTSTASGLSNDCRAWQENTQPFMEELLLHVCTFLDAVLRDCSKKSSKMLLEILVENQNDVAVSFFFSFLYFLQVRLNLS